MSTFQMDIPEPVELPSTVGESIGNDDGKVVAIRAITDHHLRFEDEDTAAFEPGDVVVTCAAYGALAVHRGQAEYITDSVVVTCAGEDEYFFLNCTGLTDAEIKARSHSGNPVPLITGISFLLPPPTRFDGEVPS